jgi:hypothetical protein
MSTAEQDRHDLHARLEDLIGRDEAATLMPRLRRRPAELTPIRR